MTNTIIVNGVPINVDTESLLKLIAASGDHEPKSTPLMQDYVPKWFEMYKKPKLKLKTILCYNTILNYHIIPFFGEMEVGQVTTGDIQSFFEKLSYASTSTVKHIKDALHQIFDSAKEDGYIEKNPADSKRLVIPQKVTERKALTIEQVQHIIEQMDKLKEKDRMLIMLLLYTGERKGEVRGLRWEDIDFVSNLIHVRRAISGARNAPVVCGTKSKAGVRDVPLLPELKHFLQHYPHKVGYLLGGQEALSDTQYRRTFERISKAINLYGASSHVFRHTFLTMAASYLDPKTLQAIAGHASCKITMDRYVHKRDEKVIESTQKLSGMFG